MMSGAVSVHRVVRLLTAAAFASSMSMRVCDPLLPKLAADFGIAVPAAASVITVFAIAYGVLQLAIGPLADRAGKYRVVCIATLLAAAASLACALAPGLGWLLAARIVAGGVGGAIIPVAFAWIGDEVAYEERQSVLARVMGGGLLGLICGQLVGGFFADEIGWRWAFVALAVMFAVVGLMLARAPVARASSRALPGAAAPLHPLALIRNYAAIARPVWSRIVLVSVALEGMLMYGAVAFVPSALHVRFAIPLWQAGAISAMVGAGGFVYTLFAGRLIARLGERRLAATGGSIAGVGLFVLAFAPSPWVAVAGSATLGLGFYGFHNTLQVHGTQLSSTQRGMGIALFALCLFAGQSVGVALASAVVAFTGYGQAIACAGVAFVLLAAGFSVSLGRYQAAR